MFQRFSQHALWQAQVMRGCISELLYHLWYLSIYRDRKPLESIEWRSDMIFYFLLKSILRLLHGEWVVGTGMEARRRLEGATPVIRMRGHGGLGQNNNWMFFKKSSPSNPTPRNIS